MFFEWACAIFLYGLNPVAPWNDEMLPIPWKNKWLTDGPTKMKDVRENVGYLHVCFAGEGC